MSQRGEKEQADQSDERPIPPRPVALAIRHEGIPAEMKELRRWVVWVYVWKANERGEYRWTKSPYCPWLDDDGRHPQMDSTDSRTWGSYDQAAAFAARYKWTGSDGVDGIGFVLSGSGATGVDFDHCRDRETGLLDPWVAAQIDLLDSYTEVSPSGTGVKLIVYGEKPAGRCRSHRIEMYSTGRFFTVTGHALPGRSSVRDAGSALREIHAREFPPEEKDLQTGAGPKTCWLPEDDVILDRAENAKNGAKFKRLWSGNWQGDYPTQSEADQALCSILAWWANNDPGRIDTLFRRSKLYRDKWDRQDYRTRTISPVVSGSCYDWSAAAAADEEDRAEKFFVEKYWQRETLPEHKVGAGEAKFASERDAPPARKRRGFKLGDLRHLPPVRFLVKQHLATNSFAVLYGPSGAGKSFVGIEMAMSICTGRPYLGMYEVRRGPVVYLSGEGNAGIGRRFEAWCQFHKIDPPDNLLLIPYQFDLLAPEEVAEVVEIIHTDLGEPPVAVFGDTVARLFGAGDENSTKDMGAFVRAADTIRAATGAAFVAVHHTGKDPLRGERGNSALRAATDTMILVDETDGGRGSLVSCTKQKEFDQFDNYIVRRRVVELGVDDEGEEVTSCVLVPQDTGRTKYQLLPKKKKDQLATLWGTHGANAFGPTEAAKTLGLSKSAAGEALKYLAEKGVAEATGGRYAVAPAVRSVIMAG